MRSVACQRCCTQRLFAVPELCWWLDQPPRGRATRAKAGRGLLAWQRGMLQGAMPGSSHSAGTRLQPLADWAMPACADNQCLEL